LESGERFPIMKTALWIVSGLLALLVTALVLAAVFVTGEQVRPLAERAASAALGREVQIERLDLHKSWTFGVDLEGIRVANADWGAADSLAAIRHLRVRFKLGSLLEPQLDFPVIEASGADVSLEVRPDGAQNWTAAAHVADTATPEERSEFPRLREINLRDSKLDYQERSRNLRHQITLEEGTGSASETEGVSFEGQGTLNNEAMKIAFKGGSYETLVSGERPYPIDLSLDASTSLALKGSIARPATFDGVAIEMRIKGDDLSQFGDLLHLPLPQTPPYDLRGDLTTDGSRYKLSDFSGSIGDSDARGTVAVDLGGKVPKLAGQVRSNRLDFDDLAGLIGATPDPKETASPEQRKQAKQADLIPAVPVPVKELRRAEIDLEYEAASVSAPLAQVDSIAANVKLEDGRLLVRPLSAGIAGGTAKGEIALNVREAVPSADVDLSIDSIELRRFFSDTSFVQEMGGNLSGAIYLLGVGDTLDAMLKQAKGGGHLVMRDGSVSGLVVEAAGLDVVEALGVVVSGDAPIPIRCAVAAISAEQGVFSIRRGAVDTTDSLIIMEGEVNLNDRTLNVQVEAHAKDFSLIDASAPVVLSGSMTDPTISIGGVDPLPFLEMGDQKDVDCAALIDAAKQAAPGRPQ
jgi:AsmA family protein